MSREEIAYIEKLVAINRVAKVVKGGKKFSFSALVVVGDGKGRVGFATGKAREVSDAVKKASEKAKRSLVRIPLRESRTLHHDVFGRFGSGKVVLRSAVSGTGIIAGGAMRAVFEALGIQDVVSKCIGSANLLIAHVIVRCESGVRWGSYPWAEPSTLRPSPSPFAVTARAGRAAR